MEFSRRDVIGQLKNLGYDEVPDEVINEFIAELKQDKLLNEPYKKNLRNRSQYYSNDHYQTPKKVQIKKQQFGVPREPIIRDENVENSEEDDEEIEISVKEEVSRDNRRKKKFKRYEKPMMINESYEAPSLKDREEKKVKNKKRKVLFSPPKVKKYRSDDEEDDYVEYKRPKTANPYRRRAPVRRRKKKKKVVYTRYKKKTDPVSLYHQLKSNWDKDRFLTKSKRNRPQLRYQVRQEMLEISRNVDLGML